MRKVSRWCLGWLICSISFRCQHLFTLIACVSRWKTNICCCSKCVLEVSVDRRGDPPYKWHVLFSTFYLYLLHKCLLFMESLKPSEAFVWSASFTSSFKSLMFNLTMVSKPNHATNNTQFLNLCPSPLTIKLSLPLLQRKTERKKSLWEVC